jgi:hypothetical protein
MTYRRSNDHEKFDRQRKRNEGTCFQLTQMTASTRTTQSLFSTWPVSEVLNAPLSAIRCSKVIALPMITRDAMAPRGCERSRHPLGMHLGYR